MTEYILLVAVSAAIVIKLKGQIEAKLFPAEPMKVDYKYYYDDVSRNNLFD